MKAAFTRMFFLLLLLPATILPAQEAVRQHFEAGQKYQASGETTLAESEFRQALGLVLEQLGSILTAQERYDDALRAYSEAAEARANSEGAMLGQGIVYLLQRKADPGIQVVEKLLERNPSHFQGRHLLGKLYMLAGRFKEAVSELEFVVSKRPADMGAAYTLAMVYLEDRQLQPAQKIFANLVQILGDSAELEILIGKAYKEMRFLDEAADAFEKAIALNPRARRAHFYLGQTLLIREGTNKIDDAIELFQKELTLQPNDFSTNFLLGVAYREKRQFALSTTALTRAVKTNPSSADAFHYLGSAYYSSGRYLNAAAALKKAVDLTTDVSRSEYQVANTHYMLSQVFRKLGKIAEADKELRLSSDLKNKSARAVTDSLDAFLKADSSAKVSGLSMEGKDGPGSVTLEIVPPSQFLPQGGKPVEAEIRHTAAAVYNSLALLRASQGDHARAAGLFERAYRWKEDLPDLRYNLALSYYMMKSFDHSIPLLEKERLLKPSHAAIQRMLGLSYFYSGDFNHALPLIRGSLQARPQDQELATALAISELRTGRPLEGEKILRSLLEKNPSQAALHLLLGQALAQQTSYAAAAEEFREALRIDPSLPEANYSLGMAQLRSGRFDDAESAFRAELQIRPRDSKSHYHLGYLYQMRHKVDEAIAEWSKAIELEPSYAEAHYQLGKSLFQEGKWEEARARLEKAAEIDPQKDYIHYQLAQTYSRLGRESEAQKELDKYRVLKARRPAAPEISAPPDEK